MSSKMVYWTCIEKGSLRLQLRDPNYKFNLIKSSYLISFNWLSLGQMVRIHLLNVSKLIIFFSFLYKNVNQVGPMASMG